MHERLGPPMGRRTLHLAALAAAGTSLGLSGHAQPLSPAVGWPTRTVRLLVGFPGGSTPDMLARSLAEPLAKALGQAVIVENRPGASGNIAAELVARASDDHTLGVVGNGNLTSARMLDPRLPYDPAKDFSFLCLLATAPLVLVAPATLPAGAAFFAAAAREGDRWNYGSVGNGSVGHLGMEVLKTKVPDLLPVHIPFKGNPDVITGLLGGQIQMALVPPGIAMPQIRAGKLQAIGLAGGRSAVAPEIASLADAGVRDLDLEVWAALVGPSRLAPAAQNRLVAEVPRIIRGAETRQNLLNQGWQAVGTSPDALKMRIRDETALMARIISARGIRLE